MKESDYEPIAVILDKTWPFYFSDVCGKDLAKTAGTWYISNDYSEADFAEVAVEDGKPVAFVLARSSSEGNRHPEAAETAAACLDELMKSDSGVKFAEFMRQAFEGFNELMEKTGRKYDAFVIVFMSDSDYRGRGIGKTLFSHATRWMADNGYKTFNLFTDPNCSYGFYDHWGMTRRAEGVKHFIAGGEERDYRMFIYDNLPPE